MPLLSDQQVIQRIFTHIDEKTTDLADESWREAIENYRSQDRLNQEIELLRKLPVPFCPAAAIPETGSFLARSAAGTPLIVTRDEQGEVKAYRNACRHRGMQLAQGSGQTGVFVCPYHAWAYGLDGSLQHIPHDYGFPDLNKCEHSLVAVTAFERHGLVFVIQEESDNRGALDGLDDIPQLIGDDQKIFASEEFVSAVNWKLDMEANLEGYHIKPTHRESFYPYGFDNLNVVETFGQNSRVTFPFRRIEKLRDIPEQERNISGLVTYVYQLFPNVIIAVLSNHTSVSISEPLSPTETRFHNFKLNNKGEGAELSEKAKKDADFVTETGGKEDAAMVAGIQESLGSGANTHFSYGKFEKAIIHFHKNLHKGLANV
ncbi:MAG: Rieske 2Fe-2S domain-containing protein [Gammaproteobacteria bacterium]|nr:Rieske 2Fe-2S domain-containing protein [Gammaproteobacteria bacterium]MDD9894703.1 Rieske 2Fe-2S domain-containing protein [Gammaproteobacteria bacterium]MDD9957377.1 Rieske 2Fe-2S domain-containing protein [Gammaproteobacteria bacterium]